MLGPEAMVVLLFLNISFITRLLFTGYFTSQSNKSFNFENVNKIKQCFIWVRVKRSHVVLPPLIYSTQITKATKASLLIILTESNRIASPPLFFVCQRQTMLNV